jgi:RNA polymerase sigma-70 factor, ECF subfamily
MSLPSEGFPIEEHMPAVMGTSLGSALDRIFQDHYALVYRTARSITRSVEDAEDVAQTVFLRLMRLEKPPDLTKNPKGYFYRAAVNTSLRVVRSRQRVVLTGEAETEKSTEGPCNDSDEALDRRLWAAIAELPERAAQILVLKYVHGQSLAEIAKLLGTSSGVVAVSLFRSRTRLKKLIRAAEKEES